jgi:deoxyribodipyrimidine photo-lyase
MPAAPSSKCPSVVWFKRDLRVFDHAPLTAAAECGPVIPLYVVEPALWAQPDASHRQYVFTRACAAELSEELAALRAPLVVRVGSVADVLDELHRRFQFNKLWSHEETGNAWTFARDRAVAAWCRHRQVVWHEVAQTGVVRRLKTRDGWAQRWDRLMAKPVLPPPAILCAVDSLEPYGFPDPSELGLWPDGCTEPQTGGRQAGLQILNSFLTQRGRDYRRGMSSPLQGANQCSRLSPYLATGALSMREVTQAAWQRQRALRGDRSPDATAWRQSLVSFSGRLHWHCHFMQKLESEPAIEIRELHPFARGLRPQPGGAALLAAWAMGATGYPFIDACMRSLIATGWLNFRMRAMLVSFASYNLWLPWQETGLHLARMFTDYEPGIHWPQMQMQSGATGINTIRIYNPVKQGHDQDATGAFTRRWVPELADVPDRFLQEPWNWPGASGVIGIHYPTRVVDLAMTTAAAKDRIYSGRKTLAFDQAADAIQDKHGSRKSNLPMTGQTPRKRRQRTQSDTQLTLDLAPPDNA